MKRSVLRLEKFTADNNANSFRTVFKNNHGRILYLSVEVSDSVCTITDCFYIDRTQNRVGAERYNSKPQKLRTIQFPIDELLSVTAAELDKSFCDVEFIQNSRIFLTLEEYIRAWSDEENHKYRFLIMVGEGNSINGLPVRLRTRLKNRLHRSIYIELEYYKDGQGVVKQCFYYDRKYIRQGIKITPPMLISCFFPYTREGIINLLNCEICCNFTHMIITEGIDLDSDCTPICGSL